VVAPEEVDSPNIDAHFHLEVPNLIEGGGGVRPIYTSSELSPRVGMARMTCYLIGGVSWPPVV
jgi:hypothetical protein